MTNGFNLTAKMVEAAKASDKVRKLEDGNGLRLIINPTGTKNWIVRLKENGVRRERGLGGYPAVSLAEARDKAMALRSGRELAPTPTLAPVASQPVPMAVVEVPRSPAVTLETFEAAAIRYHNDNEASWKGRTVAKDWLSRMERWVFPVIGGKTGPEITATDLETVLRSLGDMPATVKKLRGHLRDVMWTMAKVAHSARIAMDNPDTLMKLANAGSGRRKKHQERHHPAMRLDDVTGFFRDLYSTNAGFLTRCALALVVLTAKRSSEVREAKWSEFDLDKRVWTIPAARMKMERSHREPLSRHAVAILELARLAGQGSEYVFPNIHTGNPITDVGLLRLLQRMGYKDVNGELCTVHGFRSTFKVWSRKMMTKYPDFLSELALAHGDENKVREAYARSGDASGDLLDKRRALMEEWASAAVGFEAAPDRLLLAA